MWSSWARYVYDANIPRFLQFAKNVWNVDIDFEHPEVSINKAIDLQENYYKSIGMPTSLSELGVKESDFEKLALNCSRNKQRVLNGYKKLGYDEMLAIKFIVIKKTTMRTVPIVVYIVVYQDLNKSIIHQNLFQKHLEEEEYPLLKNVL